MAGDSFRFKGIPTGIAHLFLDFDGTLVNSEELAVSADFGLIQARGLDITFDQLINDYLNLSISEFAKVLEAKSPRRFDWKADLEATYSSVMERELKSQSGVLQFLHQIKTTFSITTNSTKSQLEAKLAMSELPAIWSANAITADVVSRRKPDPETYFLALERTGLSPENVLAVEDSVQGVSAATLAGIQTIGFSGSVHSPSQLTEAGAVEIFNSWFSPSPLLLSLQ